jgi:hypothetical protein
MYRETIAAATGLTDPADLREVEQLMRVESGGTLDRFSRQQLIRMAKRARKDALAMEPSVRAFYRGEARP